MQRFVSARTILRLICLVCAIGPATPALAWDVVLPQSSVRPTSGLTIKTDGKGVCGNGYHIVRVFVGPLQGRSKATRTVMITITINSGARNGFVVSKAVELPQGSKGVVEKIAVPANQYWWSYGVRVEESGKVLSDLSTRSVSMSARSSGNSNEPCNILVVDSDAPNREQLANRAALTRRFSGADSGGKGSRGKLPDIRFMVAPLAPTGSPNYAYYGSLFSTSASSKRQSKAPKRATDLEILRCVRVQDGLVLRPFQELPDQWLYLTAFDVVVISDEDLQQLKTSAKDHWLALRHWLAAGGMLVVVGGGIENRQLVALDKQLEAPSDVGFLARGPVWQQPNASSRGTALKGRKRLEEYGSAQVFSDGSAEPAEDTSSSPVSDQSGSSKPVEDPFDFRWRRVEFGQVVAVAPRDPFPGRIEDWTWMFNELGQGQWSWTDRHGISTVGDNPDTWSLLVPGIGTPPVGMFLILISLFIILVGPVNYVLLRRWDRLYLLLVTVPVAAAVVVASTLGYAILADGLGVKLRVRSLTMLDQRTGQQVSWSWQTYYASLVPSRGLTFPADAAVYPVPGEMNDSGRWAFARHLVWEDTTQRLATGYLGSRIPSMFLVIQPRQSDLCLEVRAAGKKGAELAVTNRLQAHIRMLAISGDDGQLYWTENLAIGAPVHPEPLAATAIDEKISAAFRSHQRVIPDGVAPGSMGSRRGWLMGGLYFGRRTSPTIATSLIERQLTAVEMGLNQLPPRHYVAIVDAPPSVPVGDAEAVRIADFHVVLGRW